MMFLSHLISGISLGSIYAIIALGYTMVYGIAKTSQTVKGHAGELFNHQIVQFFRSHVSGGISSGASLIQCINAVIAI